mgnify:FL=1
MTLYWAADDGGDLVHHEEMHMTLRFPNGAQFGFSTTISAAISATAISNTNPAEVTTASGARAADDVVVIQSSHPMLNNLATQVGEVAAGVAELLGLDTSDATLYDNLGEASVTLLKASGFVDFTQQGDPTTGGGDQQFWTGVLLEDRSGQQISIPTFKNAKTITVPLHYDPTLPWYQAAVKADLKKAPVVIRCKLPDGDTIYRYGYISFDGDPTMSANNPMGNTATFTSLGRAILVEAT